MSTPTYEQLSALCAQMAAALEASREELRLIRMKDCDTVYNPALHVQTELALTAYRTLSPDPQWQRVPEKPSADVVQAAIDTFGVQPGYAAMERAIKAAFSRARGENGK